MISKNYEIPGNPPQRGLVQFETELDFILYFTLKKLKLKLLLNDK